ncbi:MAG: rhodanese-related sulfurtransferase [Leptolyngbyaceae cyanobacterium SM1_1_3]|nr:rhodanese-related sulfurtransferase [Leptolyngbyaceae cyanobacterium SM1_1_3]NJN02758.1 rhodanese-related sulfurtransferase [Leptolyngbyaceae cyanobacterium RM1_1_2]NJO09307.1 rhodanese-related sulfurtransferase [Leptolyngbyaceae cyanobacterium SL_1_1]
MTIVAAFYRFVSLPDAPNLQKNLSDQCEANGIKGTILLADEGINATIAGSRQGIEAVLTFLQQDSRFDNLEVRESEAQTPPFERLKVRLKREIVTFGNATANPAYQVGTYVDPKDWNQLIDDPTTLVIDTRNEYEVSIGTFASAVNPQTRSFREFPGYVQTHLDPQKHTRVAMFCTGGIRCEKASAYLLSQGFEQVYHLQGGILRYLKEVPPAESRWQGECFVFDERVAVGHGLEPGSYEMCHACGHPIEQAAQASPQYEAGISCPACYDRLTPERRDRLRQRQQQQAQSNQKSDQIAESGT